MIIEFFDIAWDTDDTLPDKLGLPSEVLLEVDDNLNVDEEGAEILSEKYGWLVHGFHWVRVTD